MGLMDRLVKKQTTDGKSAAKAPAKSASAKTAEANKPAAATDAVVITATAHKIIVRPLVTEKASHAATLNQYSFIVNRAATKLQVSRAVKEMYGVMPVGVNVINVSGRRLRFGKGAGRRSDYKKAIVTLPKGSSITIHEGV